MNGRIEARILFTGPPNAGKTTAIGTLSDVVPIVTDVDGRALSSGESSAPGFDYGVVRIDGSEHVHLYGTRGRKRCDSTWRTLARNAIGVVILIDNSHARAMSHLDEFLVGLKGVLGEVACVVGVGRTQAHPLPSLDAFATRLAFHGYMFPVVEVDVRSRDDVLLLVALLLAQADARLLLVQP